MSLKIFSIRNAYTNVIILIAMGGILSSCTPRLIKPSPNPERVPVYTPAPMPIPTPEPEVITIPTEPETQPGPVADAPKPRLLASLQLTQQAQALLKEQQPDNAIRVLERAVSIDPSNGQNYYYLAEAWLMKEDTEQALNFNELAVIHLGTDKNWKTRITNQKQRIEKLIK